MIWFFLLLGGAALAQPQPPPGGGVRAPGEQQQASVAVQRDAVRRQAAAVGNLRLPWSGADPGAPPCDAVAESVLGPIVESAAKAQNVKPELLRAVIEQESGFRACAVSAKGAMGLMQLMPATVAEFDVKDPFDPRENVEAGARYLKQLLGKYKGDLAQALGAYNAGPGAADQAGGVPDIPETLDYVRAILAKVEK